MATELVRPRVLERSSPGGSNDTNNSGDATPGMANVWSGLYGQEFPVAGMSVAEVRQRLGSQLQIERQAQAVLNGQPIVGGAERFTRIGVNDTLTFVRRAGEKGAGERQP